LGFIVVLLRFIVIHTSPRRSQRTPLIYAAAGNHIEACQTLIAARADVNARDDE
jgi:ankyrin repeat protein